MKRRPLILPRGHGLYWVHAGTPAGATERSPPVARSTRELAELAGTTVKSVRYYHQLGLLDEPERLGNGYKQYEVRHLVRLLQITRLTELGVPLAQIESIGSTDDDPQGALRAPSTPHSPPRSNGCNGSGANWRPSCRTAPARPCPGVSPKRGAT